MKEEARKKERLIFSEAQDPEDAEPGECQVEGTIEEFWASKHFCRQFTAAVDNLLCINNKGFAYTSKLILYNDFS